MHVPGKEFVIADTLSRALVKGESDTKLEEEVQAYVDCVLSDLPTTEKHLKEIRAGQQNDEVCCTISEFCENG